MTCQWCGRPTVPRVYGHSMRYCSASCRAASSVSQVQSLEPSKTETLCGSCFTYHAGECW
jgi:hypothetical protein